ncbi:TPA: hypothetical protein ACN36H_003100 [Vibrio parahaemolyticus]
MSSRLRVTDVEGINFPQLLIDNENLCVESYCAANYLYVYDMDLFDRLMGFKVNELLELFDNVRMTNDQHDGVWLDFSISPYNYEYKRDDEGHLYKLVLRYDPEDWNRLWSIREHFYEFKEKVSSIDCVELYCSVDDSDLDTGLPIYNLLNGFGVIIVGGYDSKPISEVYKLLRTTLTKINDEVIKELSERTNPVVLEKCIEFPPEYHHAGVGILSYFGTYLSKQYPNEKATVKIEQNGLNVKMTIEPLSGKKEVVERALHEYEAIICSKERIETLTNNESLILELNNELRIAKFRIESQKDLIGLQNGRIDRLLDIVACGLSKSNQTNIDFKPQITVNNTNTITQSISQTIGGIEEILDLLSNNSREVPELEKLKEFLLEIETNGSAEDIRGAEKGSELNTTLKNASSAWEVFKELLNNYNKIAEWCGLPQVPSVLIQGR